jgi:hypothetical protein
VNPATLPSPTLPAAGSSLNADENHTCARCPACATETCLVLQDLGMACETMCAASEAEAAAERDARRNVGT